MSPAEGIKYLQGLPTDEPVFVLRAKDILAPGCVQSWAAICLLATNSESTRHKGAKAMTLADEMRDWQRRNSSKIPD